MSAYDHYAEAKRVAVLLTADGYPSEGQDLLKAISEGTSGTEIFMISRLVLEPFLNAGDLSAATRERVRVLYERLDEALR